MGFRMNKLLLVLMMIFGFAKAQIKSEMSSFLVSERFQLHNGLVHYKVWGLFDVIIQNSREFRMQDSEIEALMNAKFSFFPVDYLLREEEHWITKSYRSIPIFNENNAHLKLDKAILQQFKNLNSSRWYSSGMLDQVIQTQDLQKIKWEEINEIVVREDWVYNRMKGMMESFITSIGFAVYHDGNRKYLAWANFNSFSADFNTVFPKHKLISILKNKQLYSDIFYTYMDDMDGQINLLGRDYTLHNLYIEIQKINEYLSLPKVVDKKGNVAFVDKSLNTKIKGNCWEGKLEMMDNQNNVLLELNFKNKVLNGAYSFFYSNGTLREKGVFVGGLKNGECLQYYSTSKIAAKRVYFSGVMEGEQREFHPNGSPAIVYNYQNGFLNGSFNQYYKDGTLMQSGFFVNGLINGNWTYNLIIPKVLSDVIGKNAELFNRKFILEKKWTANQFAGKVFNFKAFVEQIPSPECIQGICTQVEIL